MKGLNFARAAPASPCQTCGAGGPGQATRGVFWGCHTLALGHVSLLWLCLSPLWPLVLMSCVCSALCHAMGWRCLCLCTITLTCTMQFTCPMFLCICCQDFDLYRVCWYACRHLQWPWGSKSCCSIRRVLCGFCITCQGSISSKSVLWAISNSSAAYASGSCYLACRQQLRLDS